MEIEDCEVLVVDDHPMTRDLVKSILRHRGFPCTTADGGKTALRALSKENSNYQLVVCDWNMPDLQGIEVLKAARNSTKYKKIPFILLTAEATADKVHAAIEERVDDYILKPFTASRLMEAVIRVMKSPHPDIAERLSQSMVIAS